MKNKRAALGDYLDLIYRIAIITLTVAIIFGTYTFVFRPTVDIKDSEATILQKKLYNCFNEGNNFNLQKFQNSDNHILENCLIKTNDLDSSRYYIHMVQMDSSENILNEISSGDSGKSWITMVSQSKENSWDKYYPGFSNLTYSINNKGSVEKLNIEVWVNEI